MEIYEQAIYVSYAKNIECVKLKHKVNKKAFFGGLLSATMFVLFSFCVYNIIQILF